MTNSSTLTCDGREGEAGLQRRLRIALVSTRDSNDRRSWSGTLYNMGQALERHCGNVLRIGPLEPRSLKIGKLISSAVRRFTNSKLHVYKYRFGGKENKPDG